MILKGNIRAGGQELARHLMNNRLEIDPNDSYQLPVLGNEHVEVAELRGFASQDLAGAFQEIEGVAAGTNCTKPIYSLSINPSEPMSREEYGQAIERIEKKLGLQDQARAVVFHVKGGREHCHVAWSRIDLDRMQARHMEFDRQKLRETARELVRTFGHEMPRWLGEDRGVDRFKDRFQAVSLAERGQEQRTGISPAKRRAEVTEAYRQSDSAVAFRTALQERGYTLSQGDRRNFVVVDQAGEVHSLNRQIEGAKAKEIRDTLQLEQLKDLPTIQQAKEQQAELAHHRASERPQEHDDLVEGVKTAEKALQAVRGAEKAELKALKGEYREQLKVIRTEQVTRIEQSKTAIKDAYRSEWGDLFKRQKQDLKNFEASGFVRLKHAMQNRTEGRLMTMLRAFHKDHGQLATFLKFQETERKELASYQKAAERAEVREIKQQSQQQRVEAREQHREAVIVARESYTEQLGIAAERLDVSRKLIDDQAHDMTEHEARSGFGFSHQGFDHGGGISFGHHRDDDRDDEERQLKPPSQSFTP